MLEETQWTVTVHADLVVPGLRGNTTSRIYTISEMQKSSSCSSPNMAYQLARHEVGYVCDSCFVRKHEAQGHWLFDQSKKMQLL